MSTRPTVLEWFEHHVETTPDRHYLTQPLGGGDANIKRWTFKEAYEEAGRMAAYLAAQGYPPKSQIAICSKNCAQWILADLAIWMAGHVSVPIFPTLTADTVKYILEHSETRLLFVGKLDPVWAEMKPGVPADLPQVAFPLAPESEQGLPQWDALVAEQAAPIAERAKRDPAEMATIVYTSGSTGTPKGVMLSFGAMCDSAVGVKEFLGAEARDRMLSYLPLAHAFERWAVECQSYVSGCELFFAESLDTFVADLRRAHPTLFISVPRLWLKFQQGVFKKMPPGKLSLFLAIPILSGIVKKKVLTGLGLDAVRFAGSGSAPIPGELIAWYRRLGLELLEGYGMSENFSYSHINRPGLVKVGTVGPPNPGVECRLSDEGEVLVKSPGMMMGYYKEPEMTAEVLTDDGFLKTGDRGAIDPQQRLTLTGRVKELFKTSKGKYVAPAPIENRVLNHPRIEACCVTGSGQPQPFALVVLAEDARKAAGNGERDAIDRELAEHLQAINAGLDHHEHLQFLCVVKDVWLPENGFLTPTLKIKRAKLEETYGPAVEGWYGQKKPVVWQS